LSFYISILPAMPASKFLETGMSNPNCNFFLKMITRTGIAVLLVLLLSLGGCSGKSASTPTPARTDSPTQSNPLQQEITAIAALAKGRVGVSAVVLETGETIAELNTQDHFPMQSVYKLPISMAVMKQVDEGK